MMLVIEIALVGFVAGALGGVIGARAFLRRAMKGFDL